MVQQWAWGTGRWCRVGGHREVLRGMEKDGGIWRQTLRTQTLLPGSLGPFVKHPLSTGNHLDKPCPRRTVPLRLGWAGPAVSMELSLGCFSMSSPLQAQTGSESPQENEGRSALAGYSREPRSHPTPWG